MKTFLLFPLTLSLAFVLSGCGNSHAQDTAVAEPVPASVYKEGHGLQLTPAGRQFIGLATSEVVSHTFAGQGETTAIPATAVLRTIKGDFVYVANGEWFLRTPVTLGASDATHVEILDGLYEGDVVVVRGVSGLSLAEIQALNGGVGCADGH